LNCYFDCFISYLYMRVLKLTLGKIIFLQIFVWFSAFQCEASRRTWLTVWTQAALPIANLAVYRSDKLVTRSDAILTGFYLSLAFSAIHIPLHFFLFIYHVMLCVFLTDFSKILAFSAHLFSFHDIFCVFLYSFKLLCLLEYWNIFLRYCAWKSYYVYVLGWYLYICAIWIAIFAFVILRHPIDSRHNITFFLEITRFNLSWWWYFWIYFYLNLFRNMSSNSTQQSVRQMDPLENRLLLNSYIQYPKFSWFRWACSLSSCKAFHSIFLKSVSVRGSVVNLLIYLA